MKKTVIITMLFFILIGGILFMIERNIQMGQRNDSNTEWDNHYPITKVENVITSNGTIESDLEENKQEIEFASVFNKCNFALSAKKMEPFPQYKTLSGKIIEWYDQGINAFDLQKAYQPEVSSQPDYIEKIPYATKKVTLPDISVGAAGKGFTCTGVSYDALENVFYVGNIGKALPSTPGFKSTIVKLSKDGKTNLGEIKLYETYPTMSDVQGVTIDTSDNTIWFCSFAENKIRHITKQGVNIGEISVSQPSGIAYDSRTDTLWVLTLTALKKFDKTGTELESIDVSITGQDQLYLDEHKNIMYFTAGANYTGLNFVYKVDLETKAITIAYNLKESYAVEGIYIEGSEMYIFNDGFYHTSTVPTNQINIYDITKLVSAPQFDVTDDSLVVDANSNIDNLNKITFIAVVHTHGLGGDNSGRIFDKSGASAGLLLNNVDGSNLQFIQYKSDGLVAWNVNDCITKGETAHVVITFDKSSSTNEPLFYVNGDLKTSTKQGTATGDFTNDTGTDLFIGNRADLSKALNGLIFDFYIIPKILPQEIVTGLYNSAKKYYGL